MRPITLKVSDDFLAILDNWRRRKTPIPGRSQAIRELVEVGIVKTSARHPVDNELKWAKDAVKRRNLS